MGQRTRSTVRRDGASCASRSSGRARWAGGPGRTIAVLAFAVLVLGGCGGPGGGVGSPHETPSVTAAQAIALHADSIMAIPGVVGIYEGRGASGETVIRVMLAKRTREVTRRLPRKLEGYRVEIEESGPIRPMGK